MKSEPRLIGHSFQCANNIVDLSYVRRTLVNEPQLLSNDSPARLRTYKVTYLYRDAGNYKFWGEFCILGDLSLSDVRPYLFDHEYFVPEQVGLPSLVPEVQNDDDHSLHEFFDIRPSEPGRHLCTSEELIARVRKADERGWFANIL
jgi:hypothetical protein